MIQKMLLFGFLRNIQEWGLSWWCSGWDSACQCREHGFSPWSEKIPHATEQLSPWATTTKPVCCNSWSPCALKPVLCNRDATTMRSPDTATQSSPRSSQLEKAHMQQQRPSRAKNKINTWIKKIFLRNIQEWRQHTHSSHRDHFKHATLKCVKIKEHDET